MANIRLVNITKRYGSKTVLDNISLEVRDKEFFVLAGPPGAGATTILRIVAGLEVPDSGEVYIGEQLVNDLEPKDRDVAMVFENLALYPNKTGFKNIAFPLRQKKVPENEITERVNEVARLLKIDHILDRYPRTYSGGELQRLALARAIVRRPKVYLLDQPLANIDALIRANMRSELKRLVREIGQTIIYTTHDQLEAFSMGERIAILNGGMIRQVDAPSAIYERPKDKFVASFMGSPRMNFIECRCEVKNGRTILAQESFSLDVTNSRPLSTSDGGPSDLTLGIRPENISIHLDNRSDESMEATVYVVEPMGSRALLSAHLGKNLVKALIHGGSDLKPGGKVWLEFDKNKLHLFDKETLQALATRPV
ncbi:MAG: ABC transporter ATP-binding protein [Thaumarchaeota archaeon]|nr:MAG: ABC transporter ATP-binding protein [Nitrososphaerota archaeon]